MPGLITKKTVIQHPYLMYKLCGVRGIVKVLTAKQGLPFLTVLVALHRI
jgi:hypothetical protein